MNTSLRAKTENHIVNFCLQTTTEKVLDFDFNLTCLKLQVGIQISVSTS